MDDVGTAIGYRTSHVGAEVAAGYDTGFGNPRTAQGLGWQLEQQILDSLLDSYADPGARVLDFACGTGRILELLEHRFARPTGLDASADMLAVARGKCRRSEFITGDVTTEPGLVSGHYDLATAFRFFLNAEEQLRRDVLDFLHRVLEPDGLLITNFHLNPWSARGLYLQARWLGRRRTPMLSPRSATRLLEDAGFTVLDVVGYDFLPYRRDGARQRAPVARAKIERRLAGRRRLRPIAATFIVVARADHR